MKQNRSFINNALLFFVPRGYTGFYWLNHRLLNVLMFTKKNKPKKKNQKKNIKHIHNEKNRDSSPPPKKKKKAKKKTTISPSHKTKNF